MIIEPTYSSSISFSVEGNTVKTADSYFSNMPKGLNFLVGSLDLFFETSKEDMEGLYHEFVATEGVKMLAQPPLLENFYKEIKFFPESFNQSRRSGDLYEVKVTGLASTNSTILNTGGSFVYLKDVSGFNPRIKVITDDAEFATLELEPYQVIYYANAEVKKHTFWDKIFFVGDPFLNFAKENNHDQATYINTKELFLLHATKEMPLCLQSNTNLTIKPLVADSAIGDSFRSKLRLGVNEMAWDALSLSFDDISDSEAFAMMCYLEQSSAYKSIRLTLQPPFDIVSEYLAVTFSHAFVDCDVNSVKVTMVPFVQSFVSC